MTYQYLGGAPVRVPRRRKEPRKAFAVSSSAMRYWATNGEETDDVARAMVFYKREKADALVDGLIGRYPDARVVEVSVSTEADGRLVINGYRKVATIKKGKLKLSIWRKYGGRCAYCGSFVSIRSTYMDQFYPSRGQSPDNLMPCCRKCREHKSGKTPSAFQAWIENTCRGALRKVPEYKTALAFSLVRESPRITFYYMTQEGMAQAEKAARQEEIK